MSWHVRDARVVIVPGSLSSKSLVGKTFPAFPAHAQAAIYVSDKRPISDMSLESTSTCRRPHQHYQLPCTLWLLCYYHRFSWTTRIESKHRRLQESSRSWLKNLDIFIYRPPNRTLWVSRKQTMELLVSVMRWFHVILHQTRDRPVPWWRHQIETFSALLALCEGKSPVNSLTKANESELWCFLWSGLNIHTVE